MQIFVHWLLENKTDDIFRLSFEQSQLAPTAIAKRFAKHWKVELPTEIGQWSSLGQQTSTVAA